MGKIAAIVCFCTNDYRCIKKCLQELSFLDQIIVPVCDHLFDGTPENRKLLDLTYYENPHAQFVEFAYDFNQLYNPHTLCEPGNPNWAFYWHSTARLVGYFHLDPSIEHVLFVDCDEIFEGQRFKEWLATDAHKEYAVMRPFGLYYFRSARHAAKVIHTAPLLAPVKKLSPQIIFDVKERYGMTLKIQGKKMLGITGLDGMPLYHHYSWVHTKEEALKKARSWGHRHDKDWCPEIEAEFAKPIEEQNENFIFDTECFELEPYFDPMTVEPIYPPALPNTFSNVLKVDRKAILHKWLTRDFDL